LGRLQTAHRGKEQRVAYESNALRELAFLGYSSAMATAMIEVDEKVAAALQAQAAHRNLPLSEFLKEVATSNGFINDPLPLSEVEWNRALDEVSDDLPSLPKNFSREDIYFDHD
jgi:hypothetical protein